MIKCFKKYRLLDKADNDIFNALISRKFVASFPKIANEAVCEEDGLAFFLLLSYLGFLHGYDGVFDTKISQLKGYQHVYHVKNAVIKKKLSDMADILCRNNIPMMLGDAAALYYSYLSESERQIPTTVAVVRIGDFSKACDILNKYNVNAAQHEYGGIKLVSDSLFFNQNICEEKWSSALKVSINGKTVYVPNVMDMLIKACSFENLYRMLAANKRPMVGFLWDFYRLYEMVDDKAVLTTLAKHEKKAFLLFFFEDAVRENAKAAECDFNHEQSHAYGRFLKRCEKYAWLMEKENSLRNRVRRKLLRMLIERNVK